MADLEISSLPAVTVPLSADAMAIVNDGITKQITRAQMHSLEVGEVLVLPNGDDPSIPELQFPNSGIYEDLNDELAFAQSGAKVGHLTSSAAGGMFIDNTLTGAGLERVLTTSDAAAFGEYRGEFDASIGTFPVTTNQGDWFNCTVAGTVDGQAFVIGDILVALIDSPSTVTFAANWSIVPHIGVADHLLLTNIGTNSHAAIDTHIADATLHFTEASIDHTSILNIGANTHAQIDSHIANSALHGSPWDEYNYLFDDAITASDPGAGNFRLNNVVWASATFAFIDDADSDGTDMTNVFPNVPQGGTLTVYDPTDETVWAIYSASATVDFTGYSRFTLNYVDGGGVTPADLTPLRVKFDRATSIERPVTSQSVIHYDGTRWGVVDPAKLRFGEVTNQGYIRLGPATSTSAGEAVIMAGSLSAITSSSGLWRSIGSNNNYHAIHRDSASSFGWGIDAIDMFGLHGNDDSFRIYEEVTFKIEDKAAAGTDTVGYGQLWVNSSDDSLNYRTGAGVNTDLTAAGATTFAALTDTDVTGLAANDMLFWDGGDWTTSAGRIEFADGASQSLSIGDASTKEGSLFVRGSGGGTTGVIITANAGSAYGLVSTGILSNQFLFLVADNGTENIVMKGAEVHIAGSVPTTDYVALEDDDTDFNLTGVSKVDWNITGFTAMRMDNNIYMAEQAASGADVTGYGQWWVNNTGFNPSMPFFTGESGDDMNLAGDLWDNGTLQAQATALGLDVRDTLKVGSLGSTTGNLKLGEAASPDANEAGYGQFWTLTAVPNIPMFTDDADNDGTLVRAEFAQTFTAIQTFNDDINLVFGTGSDTEMHWDNVSDRFEINVPVDGDMVIRAGTETLLSMAGGGGVSQYWNNNQVTLTADPTVTGNISGMVVKDATSQLRWVGFNDLRVMNDNVSDTLEAGHAGRMAFKDATTARTLTLASNVDLDFPVAAMTTVVNAFTSTDYTITEGASTTLYYLDGATRVDTAGGCTVGPGGVANIWRESATVYYIWGTGITA